MRSGGNTKPPLEEKDGEEDPGERPEDKAVEMKIIANTGEDIVVGEGKEKAAADHSPAYGSSLAARTWRAAGIRAS